MTSGLPRLLTADALGELALQAADSRAFRVEVLRRLRALMAFDWYVWALTDPVTGVGIDPLAYIPDRRDAARAIRLKYLEPTNRWTTLNVAASLGDRVTASRLWRELQHPAGVVDVASVVFCERANCWGFLDLWAGSVFSAGDVALLRAVAPGLTEALRISRSRTFQRPAAPPAVRGPAVVLVDDHLTVVGQTPDSDAWLRLLLPTPEQFSPIPAAAYNVAAQLLAREAGVDDGDPVARMPASDGSWVRVSAARVEPAQGIVVTIEATGPEERLDLFARAHALSAREREVVEELTRGAATAEIASRLFVSPYTVQDHLKSVFAKTGVRSRRALIARAAGTESAGASK
ncbi:MAG: LuxR C-terminal-related transcriptional regulator [Microbacterium sp.]